MYSGNERSAAVGKAGEDFVANYLRSQGYIIIKRNFSKHNSAEFVVRFMRFDNSLRQIMYNESVIIVR